MPRISSPPYALSITAGTVTSAMLATGAAAGNITSGTITNAMLASSDLGLYRHLVEAQGRLTTAAASATIYQFSGANSDLATGSSAIATTTQTIFVVQLVSADIAASGLTPKLLTRAQVLNAGTAATFSVTAGLYPLTISAGNLTYGSVVSGSTAVLTTPTANTISSASSGDFTLPSDGMYAFGYTVSTTPNTGVNLQAQLLTRNV